MIITPQSHPTIFKAFRIMDLDIGAINHFDPARDEYQVNRAGEQVNLIESALRALTEDELNTLVCGEQSEQEDIKHKLPSIVDDVLNEHFEEM